MRETDSQLKDLADISTDILLICGVDGRIEFCNRRCKHLFGEKMPKGRYFADFFEPQNAARIRKELKLAVSRSASETFQLRQASRIYNFYIHPRRENTLICISFKQAFCLKRNFFVKSAEKRLINFSDGGRIKNR